MPSEILESGEAPRGDLPDSSRYDRADGVPGVPPGEGEVTIIEYRPRPANEGRPLGGGDLK